MAIGNGTIVKEFILLGFTNHPELGTLLLLVFLTFYLLMLLGNLGMITLIWTNPGLHTPMYFLLRQLSFLDVCFSTTVLPQLLVTLASGRAVMSYEQCATQFFMFTFFGSTDCYLLALMAYDRYVAVCQPLLYVTIMTPKKRLKLVTGAYMGGLANAILRTSCTFSLSFCGDNQIDFIFCDLPPLLELSCGDTFLQELLILLFACFVILASLAMILVSYLFIIRAILQIRSAGGRAKTFSTCASHMTAVGLFFGTLAFMYVRSKSGKSLEEDKVVSLFYTAVIPMLNPLIYSLRNKEVKEALKKLLSRHRLS
ncbi:olfactory receptor 9Q1-like [Gracilinanus agilis]|uniref:olfactory receptor 9Q1-like n=1 Tax=Gracilinanus agilis TaxID=191870 RepID=UPI001CFEE72F|nr:olfactory receptor 9Q1-like [Gracilinanus agilis]XP_044538897.1 olfactory receptor 9Q1-like [Gracilinanus agilis]